MQQNFSFKAVFPDSSLALLSTNVGFAILAKQHTLFSKMKDIMHWKKTGALSHNVLILS